MNDTRTIPLRHWALTWVGLASVSVAGCNCDTQAPLDAAMSNDDAFVEVDADLDGGPTECPTIDPFTEGGEGASDPLTIPAGQARAGRLSAAMLPPNVTDLGVWAEGDFVLASSAGFALIVEDTGVSDLYDRFGGRPVGIARVEDGGLTDAGDFNEILYGFSTFLTRTESVSVMNDGSDGNAAVVRVNGPLAPIDFAGEVLDILRGGNEFAGFPSSMEYRMEPGADHVEVTMTVQNPSVRTERPRRALFGIFQGNRMPILNPATGFGALSGDVEYVAFADLDERTSWALVGPMGRPIASQIDVSGVTVMSLDQEPLAGCARVTVALGSIALGTGVNGAQSAAIRLHGGTTRTITGTVFEADGTTPVAGVHVHASVGATYHSRTTTQADGTYAMEVPMSDVSVTSWRRGSALSAATAIPMASSSGDIELPDVGYLDLDVSVDETPLPARVQVIPVSGDILAPPASHGEHEVTGGRMHVAFTPDGHVTLPVAPGDYDVIVSHGYEYTLHQERVTVTAGETVSRGVSLVHSVDTTGWLCADYHIHTTRSPDADDDADAKILGLVADGLEIPVRSEHEYADDFAPTIARLGLTAWAHGIAGEEMTTWVWGHFGVFPMVVDPTRRNGNIPNVYDGALPPDAFAEIRARADNPLLIINHPRSSGPGFGYFNVADYDRVTGMVGRADHWDEEFSVVEVFNESSFESNRDETVADWFSFLNRSRRVFAVGSSDSHHIYGAPVGYPRTCLDLGTDDVTAITPEMVRDATEAGRSYVSGGVYLEVSANGAAAGPGDTVTGAGAMGSVHVRVQAADWIDVDQLELIVDGESIAMMPITTGADPVIRFEGDLDVPVAAAGSWAIVHVRATSDMQLLHPGREPFAVSNPIFFER
ncbi:MAG: CehA/McbA family metallohydrolase [Deltaproteobacteria bacterium]|nr:CehA/McbA family metallohydrolase [Deltaproteobacteria bacterium]